MNDLTAPAQWRDLRPQRLLARLDAAPGLAEAVDGFGRSLLGALDGRTYETVALRVGARRDCRYVWRGHCLIAQAHPASPRTVQEIARIAAGPHALSGRDADVVTAVDEVLDRRASRPALSRLGSDEVPVLFATMLYDAIAALMADEDPEPDAIAVPGLETPDGAVRRLREGS